MASRARGGAAGPAAPRALLLPWAPALTLDGHNHHNGLPRAAARFLLLAPASAASAAATRWCGRGRGSPDWRPGGELGWERRREGSSLCAEEPPRRVQSRRQLRRPPTFLLKPSLLRKQVPPVDTLSEALWNATVTGDRCHWTLQAGEGCDAPAKACRRGSAAGVRGRAHVATGWKHSATCSLTPCRFTMLSSSPWCIFIRQAVQLASAPAEAIAPQAAGAHTQLRGTARSAYISIILLLPPQANATLNGPIMVFLVPVGEGSAASPPSRPPPLSGLIASSAGGQLVMGEVPPFGLPELRPSANGDGEAGCGRCQQLVGVLCQWWVGARSMHAVPHLCTRAALAHHPICSAMPSLLQCRSAAALAPLTWAARPRDCQCKTYWPCSG